jgi:hypothetical protein
MSKIPRKRKVTQLQYQLVAILVRLGGEATTREIVAQSPVKVSNGSSYAVSTNAVSQALSYLTDVVKYEGMASRGNAKWRLLADAPELVTGGSKDSSQGLLELEGV